MDLGTTTVVVALMVETSHEQGFAKPSKRERRRGRCSSPLGQGGGAARDLDLGGGSPPGRGGTQLGLEWRRWSRSDLGHEGAGG